MKQSTRIFLRLSDEQRSLYESLKASIRHDIEAGVEAFERASKNLLRVRDEKLYREEFDTFEEFCREILGHSKTHVNRMIAAADVIQGLIAQGETVLPDSERVARGLAKYPKSMRLLIWKRAKQIANRSRPNYLTIREATMQIVPAKEAQEIWVGALIERLKDIKRKLTLSVDFSPVSEESMKIVCTLLVEIERRIAELSIQAGNRLDQLEKTKRGG
jgi:hypothetical protein